jgi:hypothetical protein
MTNPYYKIPYEVREKLNPRQWLREFKFARQRVSRGWSDRDTWNGGEFLIGVTAGVLNKLGDEKSHVDWDEYFNANYPNNQGYKNLNQVAKDLNDYLDFEEESWTDRLDFEIRHDTKKLPSGHYQLVSLNTPEEERQIKKAIAAHHKEWERKYKKAKKAMVFVAVNFPGLWD